MPRHKYDIIQRCFEYVRDQIKHSYDYRCGPVTCIASEVLQYQTGYCYAKSHLLAAFVTCEFDSNRIMLPTTVVR